MNHERRDGVTVTCACGKGRGEAEAVSAGCVAVQCGWVVGQGRVGCRCFHRTVWWDVILENQSKQTYKDGIVGLRYAECLVWRWRVKRMVDG